ncbi:retinol-binding protein pinta-like isoform X1 [Chrysoperla carnea]|uniref:retinol-binding protein pinta-like isoform X1 n=1 Tax=Chrysoperla carnea TaxID=189513 RepID=UPI001D07FF3B|nr:retinol-binding protein pinta-like isoform X1 [Chrysoperla carnea]
MDKALESHRTSVFEYYKKSEKDVQSDVDIVFAALEKQTHFPKIKDENAFRKKIEAFLVFNKFSIEKTKKNLDLCYRLRNVYPDFFENWDPCTPGFEKTMKIYRCPPLPQLTKDLNRISYIDLSDKFDDSFDVFTSFKVYVMSLETRIPFDRNTGEIVIYDCSKVSMTILKQLTPTMLKTILDINLKGYSLRLAGLHFLNLPSGGIFILNLLKALIKPKLFERIHLHYNFESLHKLVPKELLPKNVGGDLPDVQTITDEWYEVMRNNRNNLIEQSKTRTDESKRIDKLNDDEYFGSMHGTFKKLDFD